MRRRSFVPLAGLLLVSPPAVAAARASQLPFYNRAVRSIEFRPDGSGRVAVVAEWLTAVADTHFVSVVQDADVILEINGGAVDRIRQAVVFQGDPGGCSASDACSGCPSTYSCYVGVPGAGCACGRLAITAFPPRPLAPGDRVEIRLAPAPGSVPETFREDDRRVVAYPSRNRVVERIGFEPIPGSRARSVRVEWAALLTPPLYGVGPNRCSAAPLPEELPLDVELLLEVNGQVVERLAQRAGYLPTDSGCSPLPPCDGKSCGMWIPTFTPGKCRHNSTGDVVFCSCSHGYAGWFTAAVNAGDRVRVSLVPAAGGAAEQFAGDDSKAAIVP